LLFQSSNIREHKNAFDVLTPWPESTSLNEFGTIGLSRPPKKLKGAVFTGFFHPKGPPLNKGSTYNVVQMQLVPQKSAAMPDSAFM